MKILIAEDDLTSQLMIKTTVFKAGYEPIVTGDGLSAYEILSKPGAPKLAILDWMMPGMDGVEVCRKIREIKTNEPVYIIILTSRDETKDIVQGLKAGADELISNSLKHAFPDKRKGEIFLRLEDRHGKVTIELTDNGIGMPDGVRINNTETLGLKVVQALIEQLKGSIELARRGGTRFILSFKKK